MAFHGVNDDAALIGFSMGGGEVVRYMSRHNRGAVSQIALISSVAPGLMQTDDNLDGVAPETFVEMEKQLVDDRAHFFTRFFKQFYGVGLIDRPVSQEVLTTPAPWRCRRDCCRRWPRCAPFRTRISPAIWRRSMCPRC
jgi:pimeloyl-ACP methyl ester carboxylesterase